MKLRTSNALRLLITALGIYVISSCSDGGDRDEASETSDSSSELAVEESLPENPLNQEQPDPELSEKLLEATPSPQDDIKDYHIGERREANVRAVYFSNKGSGEFSGGTSPLTVRVEGNDRVGLKGNLSERVLWDGKLSWQAKALESQF